MEKNIGTVNDDPEPFDASVQDCVTSEMYIIYIPCNYYMRLCTFSHHRAEMLDCVIFRSALISTLRSKSARGMYISANSIMYDKALVSTT